ncbi:MAG TPA: c-type cytochrome [Thermoanaerobaculia bacterium]|nr:c-type cytochrome [Thermoanaerobaculia bacterium]
MKPLIVSLIVVLGCTTATTNSQTSQTSQATGAAQAQTAQAAQAPQAQTAQNRNLQILPRDIPRDQLIAIMRNFSSSLGVRCNHCHVVTATEPKEVLDFPSDAKEEKRVARVMMQMTQQINGPWMTNVEAAEGEHHEAAEHAAGSEHANEQHVFCWTCHRGKPEPEMPPAPPAQTAPR